MQIPPFNPIYRVQGAQWVVIIAVALALFSCEGFADQETAVRIARVHDHYLTVDDLQGVVPPGASPEDSADLVNSFIDNWIRKTLVLDQAENNLPKDHLDVERQLEDYRTQLIVYAYEKELIRQRLDTSVTVAEIEAYYEANKSNFELKDYILKVRYLKLEQNSPDVDQAKEWFKSKDEKDGDKLRDYAQTYAVLFSIDENVWLYFDELAQQIPLDIANKEQYLERDAQFELEDEQYLYLLGVNDFQMKDSISPVDLEAQNIRNILLNKRKFELINKMKSDIYSKARERGDFEILEPTQ